VLASSFERIHRCNLVGMGILPLRLDGELRVEAGVRIEIDAAPDQLRPRAPIAVTLVRKDGSRQPIAATAAVETQFEVELLRDGGVLPHILLNATRNLNPQGEAA
jgi:aconitate hydratase